MAKSFAESLSALMEKLRSTEHHYIRCLKPNQTLKPGDWDSDFMIKQLAYSGTLEVTQIRKAGLNVRKPLKHFFQYYKVCADEPAALRAGTITKRCQLLLEQLGLSEGVVLVDVGGPAGIQRAAAEFKGRRRESKGASGCSEASREVFLGVILLSAAPSFSPVLLFSAARKCRREKILSLIHI